MWTSVLKWNPGCIEIMIVCMCNWRCFVVLQESCNSSNFTTQKSEWYKCMKDQCHLNACFCNMRSHLSNCNGTAHVCHTKCEKNHLFFSTNLLSLYACRCITSHVSQVTSTFFFHRNLTVISDSLIKIFLRIVNHQPEPPNKHWLMLMNHESSRKMITNLQIIEKVYF